MNDIPDLPLPEMKQSKHTPQEYIRDNADKYLHQLLERQQIPDAKTTRLQTGISSAVYLVQGTGQDRIIKFRRGVLAEAGALEAWGQQGVDVPKVFESGQIQDGEDQAPFLIMEAVEDHSGYLASTAANYAQEHPEAIGQFGPQLGKLMGQELAKMHSKTVDKMFGGFADNDRMRSLTAKGYLEKMVSEHRDFVIGDLGISPDHLEKGLAKLADIDFPDLGVYVHTDFGPHNILLKSTEPLQIKVFDPNPLVGDPYLDLALKVYEIEDHQQLAQLKPTDKTKATTQAVEQLNQNLLQAYTESTGKPLDQTRLLANGLFGYLAKLEFRQNRYSKNPTDQIKIQAQTAAYQKLFTQYLAG